MFWARVALPFRLNHVNVYLIDDGDTWIRAGDVMMMPDFRPAHSRTNDTGRAIA